MREHLRSGGAAILSQAVTAGSSLVLQVAALYELGKAGLGIFAILAAGIVVTYNSIHTGFIGDALSVFDRHEPGIRRALFLSSGASAVLALIVGFGGAMLFAERSAASAGLFAVALLMWTIEETGRRILMARLEFWKLVVNDVVFAVGSLGVAGIVAATGRLTIDWLVISMLVGSLAAIADSIRQLPTEEFRLGPPATAEFRRLFEFSGWRAGQIGVRPLSLLVVRVVIKNLASASSLGLLESGRLVIAPLMTAANGLGVFLLPTFVRRSKTTDDFSPAWKIAGASALVAGAFGGVAIALSPTIEQVTGKELPIALVASWVVYAIAYCANIPIVNALVARRNARTLFGGRLLDAAIGIGLAYVLTARFGVEAVPIGLAIGVVIGTLLPVVSLVRQGELAWPIVQRFVGMAPQRPSTEFLATNYSTVGRRRINLNLPRLWPNAWVWILPLLMIFGTEYKYRKRPLSSALSGSVDAAILLELGIYGFVFAYLLLFVASPPRWRRPTAIQFILRAYAAMMVVSVVYGEYPKLGSVRAAQLVIMIIYAAAVATRATRRQIHQLAHAFLGMITLSVFVGLVWRVPFSELQVNRFNWMYVHSVIAAAMLALAVVIGTAFVVRPNTRASGLPRAPRSLYGACTVICLGALIATQTRGSLAGAAAGIAVVVFLTVPRRERLPLGIIGVAGVGLLVVAFLDPILAYLSRGESTESLTSLSNRTTLWKLAYDLVLERPLTGWGLTASRGVFFEKVNLGGAHNALVNVVVDGGIIALALWLGIIVSCAVALRRLAQLRDRDVALLVGLLVNLMVNGLTTEGVGSASGVSALWLFIIASWIGVLQREHAARHADRRVADVRLQARADERRHGEADRRAPAVLTPAPELLALGPGSRTAPNAD